MKNSFLRKTLLLFLVCLVFGLKSQAQMVTTELLIPYRSQKTGSWCWAASMKMVMDFHNPPDGTSPDTISQCLLAKELQKLNLGHAYYTMIDEAPCCLNCVTHPEGCTDENIHAGLSNLTLRYNAEAVNPIPAGADYFDLIFANQGFSSIQEINYQNEPMLWNQIKKQIDDCRPFIVNLDEAPSSAVGNNHSVVVKAYREDVSANLKLVIANDPWLPCGGYQEILMPYDAFTETSMTGLDAQDFITNVESTIHTIYDGPVSGPVEKTACLSCQALTVIHGDSSSVKRTSGTDEVDAFVEPPSPGSSRSGMKTLVLTDDNEVTAKKPPQNPSSRLLTILDKHGDRVIGYPNTTLRDSAFLKQINSQGYSYAPVEFIDSRLINRSYFLACLFPPKELYKVSMPNVRVVEVLNEDIENTVASSFQQSPKGDWKLRKINTYTSLRQNIGINMPDQGNVQIKLDNSPKEEDNPTQPDFRLVKYYPFQYEFYSFSFRGKDYMAPAAYYPELELEPNTGYQEAKVLRILRKDTRDFEKRVKDTFGNLLKYKDYLNAVKQHVPQKAPQYDWLKYSQKYQEK